MFAPTRKLCLDWDKRALRMLVARTSGGGMKLEDAHSHRIPNNIDPDSPEQMGAFIADMMKRHHWRFRHAIVDVPRDKAVINRLQLPPTPDDELPSAVQFQAMKELPFPFEDAHVDFAVMQRDDEQRATEVLLAAVHNDALEQIKQTCTHAGLTPERIGLRPYANLVSLNRVVQPDAGRVLFVDLGPSATEIDIVRGDQLAFSRSANVLVPDLGAARTDDSRVSSKAEVEAVELNDERASTAVRNLVIEITRTLQAYRATDSDPGIDRIVIGGATGLESQFSQAVDERFGLPVSLYDPSGVVGAPRSDAVKLRSFSAVLGLAWGLSRDGRLEIDFLHPKKPIPPRVRMQRRIRMTGLAAAVVVVGVGGYVGSTMWRQANRLERLKTQVAEVKLPAAEAAREFQMVVETAQDWEYRAEQIVWLDHLLRLTKTVPDPGKRMLVRDLTFDGANSDITLTIWADGWSTVKDFVNALNATRIDGAPVYRATFPQWRPGSAPHEKFNGKVTVEIDLLPLAAFEAGERERESARRRRAGRELLSSIRKEQFKPQKRSTEATAVKAADAQSQGATPDAQPTDGDPSDADATPGTQPAVEKPTAPADRQSTAPKPADPTHGGPDDE